MNTSTTAAIPYTMEPFWVDFSVATAAIDVYLGQFPIHLIVLWLIGTMGFLYLVMPRVAHFLVSLVYFYTLTQMAPLFYTARQGDSMEMILYTGAAVWGSSAIYLYSFYKAMN